MTTLRPWIVFAGFSGLIAVGLGAYGTHGLADNPTAQSWVDLASRYQLIHTLALVAAALLAGRINTVGARVSAGLFAAGIVLFSGSLYVRALAPAWMPFPMLTPTGGIALMAGWLALAAAAIRRS